MYDWLKPQEIILLDSHTIICNTCKSMCMNKAMLIKIITIGDIDFNRKASIRHEKLLLVMLIKRAEVTPKVV